MVFKEEIEGFIKTINRGPLKEYFLQKTPEVIKIDWNENDIYETALYQGYLDACRTFVQPKGAKKSLPNETKKREYIEKIMKNGIACQIREYLNNPKSASFDKLHEKLCTNLKECFSKEKINVTFGQTQKIV